MSKLASVPKAVPWLTPMMAKAIALFQSTFGRGPLGGVTIGMSTSKRVYIRVPALSGHFKCYILIAAFVSFLQIYVFFHHALYLPKPLNGHTTMQMIILLLNFSACCLFIALRLTVTKEHHLIESSINSVFENVNVATLSNNKQFQDLVGAAYYGFVLTVVQLLFCSPVLLCYLKLDPFTVLISYFFPACSPNISKFCLIPMFLQVYLQLRDLSVLLLLLGSVYLELRAKLMNILRNCFLYGKLDIIYLNYVYCRLSYKNFEIFINSWNKIFVVLSQIYLVIGFWLIVNCYEIMPTTLEILCGSSFITGIFIAIFIMRLLSDTRYQSNAVVKLAGMKIRMNSFVCKSLRTKIIRRKWWAQPELPVKCGEQFAFSKFAVLKYVEALNSSATNAILLIKV